MTRDSMETTRDKESVAEERQGGAPSTVVDVADHAVTLKAFPEFPEELPAGQPLTFLVTATCANGCDLRDSVVSISELTAALGRFDNGTNYSPDLTVSSPLTTGQNRWTLRFHAADSRSNVHRDAALDVTFKTTPHETSLAIWGVPSAVVVDQSFSVSVGVKCRCNCELRGRIIEVVDDTGTVKGQTVLEDRWPGTDSLWWSTARIAAPSVDGVHFWTCRLASDDVLPPHNRATATFSFRGAPPPEHSVMVEVSDVENGRPLDDAEVRLGPYAGFTDPNGTTILEVPTGTYELGIRKEGFAAQPRVVDVREKLTVAVKAHSAPTKEIAESPVGPHHPYRD
jgi:hypothetical protein